MATATAVKPAARPAKVAKVAPQRRRAVSKPPPPADVVVVEVDDDIQFGRVVLTQPVARRWMARNIEHNRNKKQAKIAGYRADIKARKWRRTGETIKFDDAGNMIDGQNRVQAFIDSEVESLVVYVAWNVPRDAFDVIDTGASRTFADVLRSKNVSSPRYAEAAVIRRIVMWEAGNPTGVRSGGTGTKYPNPTHTQLADRYAQDAQRFDAAIARGMDMRHAKLGNSTAAGIAFFLFLQIDAGRCHQFFDEVITGANLGQQHPAKVLRDKLLRTTDTPNEQLALYIKAWNAYRKDETLSRLTKPNEAGMTAGRFPRPE